MKNQDVNKKEILNKIVPVVEKLAGQLGLDIVETDFVQESGRWHLRIFIYNQEHPVSHEDCENLTRSLDEYLDQLISVPFYLEVSSPGIERKLKSTKEYNIFRGKMIELKLRHPEEGKPRNILGKIIEYTQESDLVIQLVDSEEIIHLKDKDISSVKLKAEFNNLKGEKCD